MISCLSMKEVASSNFASSSSGTTRNPCWSAWISWPGLTDTPNTEIGTSHSTGATLDKTSRFELKNNQNLLQRNG